MSAVCLQCGVPFEAHPFGDGVTACPGDFGPDLQGVIGRAARGLRAARLLMRLAEGETDAGARGFALGMAERVTREGCDEEYLLRLERAARQREADRVDGLRLRWGYRSSLDRRFGEASGERRARDLRARFAALLALGPSYSYSIQSGKGGPAVAALLLARAEQAMSDAGWTVDFDPDREAEAEEGAPRWLGTVYDAEGESRSALGALDFGDEQPNPSEGFGRLMAAELALGSGVMSEEALTAASTAYHVASLELAGLAERVEALAFGTLQPGDERHHPAHHGLVALAERARREAARLERCSETEAQR